MLFSTSRLSESPLWKLQKSAYSQLGVKSWERGRVPFQITNNARIAAQYVDIACAAFPDQPLTLLELGGGCGKFSFLAISELLRRKIPYFRYILTDASEKNIHYWNTHPLLKPWIDEGILQTAVIDPLTEAPPPADLIIANYFFDSIPQDLFRVERGTLLEGIASIHVDGDAASFEHPSIIPLLRIHYDFHPLKKNPYPDFPESWAVLESYTECLDDVSFLFPIGALRTIRRIAESSNRDFVLLAADRGPSTVEDLKHMALLPSLHGTAFSFPVNLEAISRYLKKIGGDSLILPSSMSDFSIALFSRKPTLAKRSFDSQEFGPLRTDALDFSEILKRLEEAKWDPTLFFSFFDRIEATLDKAGASEKGKMIQGMRHVKCLFFPLFQEEALLLERLGLFFQALGDEEEAKSHFALAESFNGLPRQDSRLEAYLEVNLPRGDVLQMGGEEIQILVGLKSRKYVRIPWDEPIENIGKFDTILLFPPRVAPYRNQPAFIKEIEQQFSLDSIRYSDEDIDTFISTMGEKTNPQQILNFFVELKKKKNINGEQLKRIAKRFGIEVPDEEDHFFEILLSCTNKHMKSGSVLRAFLPAISSYDDTRFLNEVVVDPYLETKEISEPEGVWISIRKL